MGRRVNILAGCGFAGLVLAAPALAGECDPVRGGEGLVAGVVDGETLVLGDGRTVRLIGLKAPRGADALTSARAALEALALNRKIELRFAGRRLDRHGRVLAHGFIAKGSETIWLQKRMLAMGHGRAYSFKDNRGCMAGLLKAETQARLARRGVWARDRFAIRDAGRPRAMKGLANTFQIVEGRVFGVTERRNRTYINFGRNWRRDFTVSVPRKSLAGFSRARFDLAALKDRRVRVRGWIREINGPAIEATHPEQIEVLEP